ncbi:hypothetical protein C9F11_20855 [Streptomyces sp. YIM 121038]|uniref:DUF6344 domain-containing protein n=1 Tax=Streptomyces sp. YIM 121038 TaxID=2136401 RepID=UPI001110EB87|nr:DUF6344 domain-containing protein [Streptomyces sp. YIM 121038]QCX77804.1 hypothetical protein C9F11_20855 [Streptomyces sp. YIM 121038]
MPATKAMKLWATLVSAVLALFAALGFASSAAAATPVQEATTTCKSTTSAQEHVLAAWAMAYERSLPPTMKQRIRAEAHGSTPSCRHLPTTDAEAADDGSGALTSASLAAEP